MPSRCCHTFFRNKIYSFSYTYWLFRLILLKYALFIKNIVFLFHFIRTCCSLSILFKIVFLSIYSLPDLFQFLSIFIKIVFTVFFYQTILYYRFYFLLCCCLFLYCCSFRRILRTSFFCMSIYRKCKY